MFAIYQPLATDYWAVLWLQMLAAIIFQAARIEMGLLTLHWWGEKIQTVIKIFGTVTPGHPSPKLCGLNISTVVLRVNSIDKRVSGGEGWWLVLTRQMTVITSVCEHKMLQWLLLQVWSLVMMMMVTTWHCLFPDDTQLWWWPVALTPVSSVSTQTWSGARHQLWTGDNTVILMRIEKTRDEHWVHKETLLLLQSTCWKKCKKCSCSVSCFHIVWTVPD